MPNARPDDVNGGNYNEGSFDEQDDVPAHTSTRFGSGQPSNRSGRPPGAKGRTGIVRKIAAKRRTVVENGKKRRRSFLEILLIVIRNKAIKGDTRATKLFDELDGLLKLVTDQRVLATLTLPEPIPDVEEWAERCRREYAEIERKRQESG